jgi:hypothetical protein
LTKTSGPVRKEYTWPGLIRGSAWGHLISVQQVSTPEWFRQDKTTMT